MIQENRLIMLVGLIIVAISALLNAFGISKLIVERYADDTSSKEVELEPIEAPRKLMIIYLLRSLVMGYVTNAVFEHSPELQLVLESSWTFLPSMVDMLCTSIMVEDEEQQKRLDNHCKNLMISEFAAAERRVLPKLSACDEAQYVPRQLTNIEDASTMILDDTRYKLTTTCFDVRGCVIDHQPTIAGSDFKDGLRVFFARSPTWLILARPMVVEIPMVGFFGVTCDLMEDSNVMNGYHSLDYVTRSQADNQPRDDNRCMLLSLSELPKDFNQYSVNYAHKNIAFSSAYAQSLQNSKMYNMWKLYYLVPSGSQPHVQKEYYNILTVHINKPTTGAGIVINSPKQTTDVIQRTTVMLSPAKQLSITVNLTSTVTDAPITLNTNNISKALASASSFDVLVTLAVNTVTTVVYYTTPDGEQYVQTSRQVLKTRNGPVINTFFCFNTNKNDSRASYINVEPSQLMFETPNYAHKAMEFNYTMLV